MASKLARQAAATDGVMLIELLAAILVLAVGVLATIGVFGATAHANRVSELHEAEIHLAQGELERIQGLQYSKVGLTAAPGTSPDRNDPGFYVSGSPGCPNFQWDQSAGGTGPDPVIVNGCTYNSNGISFSGCSPTTTYCGGTVLPSRTVPAGCGPTSPSPCYTIGDYVTWSQDPVCLNRSNGNNICPLTYDYKRVTVEVTNVVPTGAQRGSPSATYRPIKPVLVSGIVTDPHALPLVGNPNVNNPINNPGTPCTDPATGQPVVPCNQGLGNQTANTWWLTNTIQQTTGTTYSPPSGDNSCMHYTDQLVPLVNGSLSCGGNTLGSCTPQSLVGCPRPDFLWSVAPTTGQEYNLSPNLSANTIGRVLLRDPNAAGSTPAGACSATASKTAETTELWATPPLAAGLNLTGNGGMTLYTNTLSGLGAPVTLCVGVYLETPQSGILDPLNDLCGSCTTPDQVRLGVAAYTMAAWPASPTPISFTFSNLFSSQTIAAGKSLATRIWVTAGTGCGGCSGADIVVHYDAASAQSSVQLDSQ